MKGETVDEIAAAAQVMRELSTRVAVEMPHLVDTCGTGGDAAHTFNIPTTAAFVAAAAGAHPPGHGAGGQGDDRQRLPPLIPRRCTLQLDGVAKCHGRTDLHS